MTASEIVHRCQNDHSEFPDTIEQARYDLSQGNNELLMAFKNVGYRDLPTFTKFFFGYRIFNSVPFFHREFYSAYKYGWGEEFIVVLFPRGVGKTTVCDNMTALHGLLYFNATAWKTRDYPRMTGHPHIVICSESKEAAMDFLTPIKHELENNDLVKAAFAPIATEGAFKGQHSFQFRDNSWTGSKLQLTNGAMVRVTGSGGQIRGRVSTYHRPTLIIIDDPEGKKKVTDIEIIKDTRTWFYTEVMESRYKDAVYDGRIIVVGTAVHEHCLVNHLHREEKDMFSIKYPILINGDDNKEHSIWPEEKPTEKILAERKRAIKAGRESEWLQENMNIPISKSEQPFSQEKFMYWNGKYEYDDHYKASLLYINHTMDSEGKAKHFNSYVPVTTYIGIDLASMETSKHDFSIVMVIAIDHEENKYIVDYWRKRTSIPTETRDAALALAYKYHIKQMCIETVAFQHTMLGLIKKKMQENSRGNSKKWFKIFGEKHIAQMHKEDRLGLMEDDFDRREVFFRENKDLQMIKEFREFPQGDHDDTLDGFWLAKNKAKKCPMKQLPVIGHSKKRKQKPAFINPLTAA